MTALTCEACGAPANCGVRCDPCYARTIRGLLSDSNWVRWRGCASGDRPGETMKETLQRELKGINTNRE